PAGASVTCSSGASAGAISTSSGVLVAAGAVMCGLLESAEENSVFGGAHETSIAPTAIHSLDRGIIIGVVQGRPLQGGRPAVLSPQWRKGGARAMAFTVRVDLALPTGRPLAHLWPLALEGLRRVGLGFTRPWYRPDALGDYYRWYGERP